MRRHRCVGLWVPGPSTGVIVRSPACSTFDVLLHCCTKRLGIFGELRHVHVLGINSGVAIFMQL